MKGAEPSCPDKFVYDSEACGCVCKVFKECNNMEMFDEDTCECVCPVDAEKMCDNGVFDKENCNCIIYNEN